MATVIVTGGAGFIGSHIAERFLRAGDKVLVLDDLSTGERRNIPEGAELHEMDIRSREARDFLTESRPDLLVHAAAQISVTASMREPALDASINVSGTLNLLQAFDGGKAPHMIFLSTGGAIYGEQETFPAAEEHRCLPTSVYGLSKRCVEMYLDLWSRQLGLRFLALRLSNVYGPRQDPHGEAGVVAIFAKALLEGRVPTIYGSGDQTRDFVFVEDVARAVELGWQKRQTGTFNIGTGKETSVNQLYEEIRGVLDLDLKPNYAPARLGEQQRSVIDARRAEQVLGWKPEFALREGLAKTCRWFQEVSS